jgi:Ulp1 family protease
MTVTIGQKTLKTSASSKAMKARMAVCLHLAATLLSGIKYNSEKKKTSIIQDRNNRIGSCFNSSNHNLAQFRKLIQKKQVGNGATSTQDKIKLLPITLESDAHEALLYFYFTVRYFYEHIFKVIFSRT